MGKNYYLYVVCLKSWLACLSIEITISNEMRQLEKREKCWKGFVNAISTMRPFIEDFFQR